MKNIIYYLSLFSLLFVFACSDDDVINEQSGQETLKTYTITCKFNVPKSALAQNAPNTKALIPVKTGQVSKDYKMSETYDCNKVFLRLNELTAYLEIPIHTGDRGERYFNLTVMLGSTGKLTFMNESKKTLTSEEKQNKVYFSSLKGDIIKSIETNPQKGIVLNSEKKFVREPIGDKLFRSDVYHFDVVDNKLKVSLNGVSENNLDNLHVLMNRCTCVLQPVLIVTNGGDQLKDSGWSAWPVLEEFPNEFDIADIIPVAGHYIGGYSRVALDVNPLQLMKKYTPFTEQSTVRDGNTITGFGIGETVENDMIVNPSFIYWWHFEGNKFDQKKKTMMVMVKNNKKYPGKIKKLTVDLSKDYKGEKVSFDCNTYHKVNVLVDYNRLNDSFTKSMSPSTKSLDYEQLDIPYEVIVTPK